MSLISFNTLTKWITIKARTELIDGELINVWQDLFESLRSQLTKHKIIELPCKNNPHIILTMTSCKRLNLFTETVNSVLNTWLDLPLVDQYIVIDDNSSPEDRNVMVTKYPFIKYIMKTPDQKGHVESMNIIYNTLKKENPVYWIHIEDDFLFFNEMPYITLSVQGLNVLQHFNVKQIMFNRNYVETFDRINMGGHILYSDTDFCLHDYKPEGSRCQYWPYFSFRPSIIDVETILKLGDFTSKYTFFEMEYAKRWYANGYRTAFLNAITNIHIGKLCNTIGENAYSLNKVPQFNGQTITHKYNIKVINLEERKDRMNEIDIQLKKLNLEYDRFNAVDGKTLTLTPDIVSIFKDNDFGYRRGFIGCALSHYKLWRELLDSNDSYYIILEDDVQLIPSFVNKVQTLLNKIQDHHLIFLGYHMTTNNRQIHTKYLTDEEPIIEDLNTTLCIGGTHCYYISKEGASALVDFIDMYGIKHGIDYLMTKVQKVITAYETIPHLATAEWVDTKNENNIDSDIQHDFSPIALNISDKYIFLETLDQIGNDCYIADKHLPKCDYEIMADSIENCIAFNTLGYFKNNIQELTKSPYFGKSDGIYINKEYYFNVFKKNV